MNHAEFIQAVASRPGVLPSQAEPVTRATLEALAERISGGQARDLASQLPEELRVYVSAPHDNPIPFGLAEFFERIQARAAVDLQAATDGARAVLDTLRAAVSEKEYGDFVAQLPKEFWQLTGPAATRLQPGRIGT
ncbi:Uncharacterized conserved protein, DUF2267 family [Micromonospora purpureochromogenes]|uniref:Uncharacterized conserved protein, DUF2267 family n=1 Tax=Micromonospora purpureochromogenes TaxID=47872 RepID=A0A1C4YDG7_9ACTN|nr:DUF2267 domain-containing protein [Micromonospora purpureochromogenes]SCF18767.1 Uncharacterized conserved protein, DUF2267 family [Micromonospora purpureochromogenes]